MADFTWPTELDDAYRLLGVVGSFWAETYAGNDLVASALHAKARAQAQAQLDLLELVAAFSRFDVPVFHREEWSSLVLLESERNAPNLPRFDGTYAFDGSIRFDEPVASALFAWAAPAGLVRANVILDRITGATATYAAGVDFTLSAGVVRFRADPFLHPTAVPVEVFKDGVVVDRALTLWVYSGEYDWDTVYRQFGYVVGLRLKSSRPAKELVNAVYDGLVEGTTARCLEDFMAAVCDVPLARGTETVKYVLSDQTRKWVITDQNAYGFSPAANVVVSVGDVVQAGSPLTDALRFYDLNRGQAPDPLRALTLGRGTLAAGYFQELTFENKTVPLVVTADVGGYTKVEFELGGWPADAEKFWEDTHAKGVTANDTLAMRMDTRTNKTGQPTAAALPATINPLRFLVENVYRGNAFVVLVRPEAFGPEAVGLHAARFLRKLVPPQTLCFLVAQLGATDTVTMDGPGSETAPGYEEKVASYSGGTAEDVIAPDDYAAEDVRAHLIGGQCQ